MIVIAVKDEEGNTLIVRLLSWIPGITLATYSPHSESLLYSIGVYLGKLDSALFGIEDEAANRVLKWDLKESCKYN
jgi:Ser/Thr protein kinase RdoA (MazF antagonist)